MLVQLESQINFNLEICYVFADSDFNFRKSQVHTPAKEVKCKGFRTEQASTSVTCQRAAEQKHIGIVSNTDIYLLKKKQKKQKQSCLHCDTTLRLQPQFNI